LLMVLSPVEIKITDQNGNVMTKHNINIPGATYLEDDIGSDGNVHDKIYLPAGEYNIKVTKKAGAGLNETYSLALADLDGNIYEYLAKDKIVPADQETDEYSFVKSGTGSFFDKENSQENIFSAGTLEMQANSDNNFLEQIKPDIESLANVNINNSGKLDFKYKIKTNNLSGDLDLCNALSLKIKQDGQQIYNGNLVNLNENLNILANGNNSDLEFIASLNNDDANLQNKICNFDFIFQAWQTDQADYSAIAGFSDQEILSFSIESGHWIQEPQANLVINEVYYDTKAGEQEGDNEWVEIYNPGNSAIDISGWQICDNNSCDLIPDNNILLAKSFAIITSASSTLDFWEIPTSTVKIILNNKIGNGLANYGDRVILVNLDLEQVDAMSYGDDLYAFDLSRLDLAEGHSLEREIVGQDTDTADDWIDNIEPSPGFSN